MEEMSALIANGTWLLIPLLYESLLLDEMGLYYESGTT